MHYSNRKADRTETLRRKHVRRNKYQTPRKAVR